MHVQTTPFCKDNDGVVHAPCLPKLVVFLESNVFGWLQFVLTEPVSCLLLLSEDKGGDDHVPRLPVLEVCLCLTAVGTHTCLPFFRL